MRLPPPQLCSITNKTVILISQCNNNYPSRGHIITQHNTLTMPHSWCGWNVEHELQGINIMIVSFQNFYPRYLLSLKIFLNFSLNLCRISWEYHHCIVETSIINVMLIILFFSEVMPYSVGLPMTYIPVISLATWLLILPLIGCLAEYSLSPLVEPESDGSRY